MAARMTHCYGPKGEPGQDKHAGGHPIAHADTVEAIHQCAQRSAGQRKSLPIERARRRLTVFLDEAQRERDACNAERNIEKEYPPPSGIGGDEPAERRPQHGRDQSGPGDDGGGAQDIGLLRSAHDDQTPHRRHQGGCGALNDARGDETVKIGAEPAGGRGNREHGDGGAEHGAGPKASGHPAAGRNEDRDREHIGGDADAEMDGAVGERDRHVRQRGRDHGAVKVFHEERRGDDERNDGRARFRDASGNRFGHRTDGPVSFSAARSS